MSQEEEAATDELELPATPGTMVLGGGRTSTWPCSACLPTRFLKDPDKDNGRAKSSHAASGLDHRAAEHGSTMVESGSGLSARISPAGRRSASAPQVKRFDRSLEVFPAFPTIAPSTSVILVSSTLVVPIDSGAA